MGLLRLMGNKADVVKGLAKRCNENWKVAPTSDIVRFSSMTFASRINFEKGIISVRHSRPSDHDDAKLEPLRKNIITHTLELSSADQHRDDGREQSDQRGAFQAHGAGNHPHSDEPYHW
jgi:Mg2+ and Co2+ transporter CorA